MRLVPFLFISGLTGSGSPPVSVSLNSKWNSAPLYVEAIEFVHTLKNPDLFVKFIKHFAETPELCQKSDEELFEVIKSAGRNCALSEATLKMLSFSLSLRVYSPKIEAGRSASVPYPAECPDQAFFSISGSTFCSTSDLENFDFSKVAGSIQPTDLKISHGEKFLVLNGLPENTKYLDLLVSGLELSEKTEKVGFAIRWKFDYESGIPTPLTGYGVQLRLKSTEYKAQDDSKTESDDDGDDIESAAGFNFKILKSRFSNLQKEIRKFAKYVSDTSQEIEPMKAWQMGDLSLQAAQSAFNVHSKSGDDSSLETLTEIAGNFPQQAKKLARISVSSKLRKEVAANQDAIGRSLGLGKGGSYFAINGLSIDLTSQWGDPFLLLDTVRGELETMERLADLQITGDQAQEILRAPVPKGESEPVLKIADNEVIWLNDIETDKRYGQFSRSMHDFLRPTFPGVLRRLRYNYLNLEIFLDQTVRDIDVILELIETIFENNLPVRVGIVFTGETEEAHRRGAVLHYLVEQMKKEKKGGVAGWDKWNAMREEKFSDAILKKKYSKGNWESVVSPDSEYFEKSVSSSKYFNSLGMAPGTHILVNGAMVPDLVFDDSSGIEDKIYEFLLDAVPDIQRAVYYGQIGQGANFIEYLNSRAQVVTRFNKAILNAPVDLIDLGRVSYTGNYFGSGRAVTVWLVVDLTTDEGRNVVKEAISYQLGAEHTRLAVMHCGGESRYWDLVDSGEFNLSELLVILNGNEDATTDHTGPEISTCSSLSANTVYINGQAYQNAAQFVSADFALAVSLAVQGGAQKLAELLPDLASDKIMKVISALSFLPEIKERRTATFQAEKYSVLHYPPQRDADAVFEVIAVFDPASEDAQKMAPIIQTLRKVINMNLKIFLNSQDSLSELPIKSFYRFVLAPEPVFSSNGPQAQFLNLPQHSLFTMGLRPPESWLVAAVEAEHDLDNIKLVEQGEIVGRFQLQHLLLEGQAFDTASGSPPRGMQMDLSTADKTIDTIVMANLGYFQFKASPGYWNLKLRDGLSQDIFKIEQTTQTDGTSEDGQDVKVIISSFTSRSIRVGVAKRSGMEHLDVLGTPEDSPDEEGSIWSSIGESIGLKSKKEKKGEKKETKVINIFSLASGHMYERLMRIMMLSVIRNTETKVKFWILENYASPAFRKSLPIVSKEYGFDYEFVQYKWPRWLNAQTEQQRIMWGYKILFLDVMFPLDIDKIIFVDADQIVRADLKELVELDLEGNPYGYTPFCDDRKEMDGFRFWNGGYWKQHLAGRKYHISAIYVVDLKRFRQLAAGDRLRGQYQGLSQDPNSLANLDQDLPNNMIHQVGIKSLPQEWLWCATWCSDESKERAKTIDLCNNPLTKEHKLTAAVRLVPEWAGYDEEIKNTLSGKISEKKEEKSEKSGKEEL